jgi:hypothetical protein
MRADPGQAQADVLSWQGGKRSRPVMAVMDGGMEPDRHVDARFGPARECLLRSPGALTLTGSAEALSCRMSRCRQ